MPKAGLHIHIEGSLGRMIFPWPGAMAWIPCRCRQRRGAAPRAYAFTDLQSFLDIYYAGASVLLKEQDFYDMASAYLCAGQLWITSFTAGIFFDPQTHTRAAWRSTR